MCFSMSVRIQKSVDILEFFFFICHTPKNFMLLKFSFKLSSESWCGSSKCSCCSTCGMQLDLWLHLLEICGDASELCKLQQTSNCNLYIGICLLFLLAHWVTSYLRCISVSGLFIASFMLDSQTTLSLITLVIILSIIISILQGDCRSQGWKKYYLIMLDCKCWIEFSHIEYTIQGSLSLCFSQKAKKEQETGVGRLTSLLEILQQLLAKLSESPLLHTVFVTLLFK